MASTELILTTGEHVEVEGSAKEVEAKIVEASRSGSLEFAWLTETGTGQSVGVSAGSVAALREAGESPEPESS